MSDAIGAAWLPALAPTRSGALMTTRSPGDPALVTLGSYLATVLQANLGTAWNVLNAGMPDLAGTVDGTRAGKNIVRRVYYQNPVAKGAGATFEAPDLPGLFVYRPDTPQKAVRIAADAHRRNSTIGALWIATPAPNVDIQRLERDTFNNSVSAALFDALTYKRHPSWVVPADEADVDGLRLAAATSTLATTISSFTGALAGVEMSPPRPVCFASTAAAGAYNTTDPILVTGLDDKDVSFTDRAYLTAANGGQTVTTIFRFKTVTSILIPAQLLTTGSVSAGWYDSPEKRQGSLVLRACAFNTMVLREVKTTRFDIVREKDMPPIPMMGVEALLDVGEDGFRDPDVHAQSPYDIQAAQTTNTTDYTTLEIIG